jgi:alpha-L-rhamnosidase
MLNFDMQRFYTKYLDDIRDDQLRYSANHLNDTGPIADVVPFDGIGGLPGCPVWQIVYVVIARNMFKHYGSHAVPTLQRHYQGLEQLMAWFDRHADHVDGLLPPRACQERQCGACYGDWMGFDPESRNSGSSALTPQSSVTAFYHVLAQDYMATIAEALGKTEQHAKWTAAHKKLKAAFHLRYFNSTVGGYSPCVADKAPSGVVWPKAANRSCHGTSAAGSQVFLYFTTLTELVYKLRALWVASV